MQENNDPDSESGFFLLQNQYKDVQWHAELCSKRRDGSYLKRMIPYLYKMPADIRLQY